MIIKYSNVVKVPEPCYMLVNRTLDRFILGMLKLGKPVETLLVGAFNTEGRGAQRDMNLVLHRDGEYDEQLAKDQGDMYVEHSCGVDYVGFYCIKESLDCNTIIQVDGEEEFHEVIQRKGEALIFDNRKIKHGRVGPVGDRLLLRMWIEENKC